MTNFEKRVVSAYTGILMCKFEELHEYIEKILGRPVWTHELADDIIQKEVKEKSKNDFIAICANDESINKSTIEKWISVDDNLPPKDTLCLVTYNSFTFIARYCHNNIWTSEIGELRDIITHWIPLPSLPIKN